MNKRVAFYVIGCKVNQYEIEAFKELFIKKGYQVVDFNEEADIYIIHSCTVTHLADSKSRQIIRKAVKKNPNAIIVVTGCYAQIAPNEIEKIEGVDIIIGSSNKKNILYYVENYQKGKIAKYIDDISKCEVFEELPVVRTSRARALVKIQEGCNRFCTYCIVPYARGPVRSRDFNKTIKEVEALVNAGYKEIVLTGIHIGTYGTESSAMYNFSDLLVELIKIPELKRLRIGSLNPDDITSQLLEVIVDDKICPHFHISLQSGDDEILKKMGRRYTTAQYEKLLSEIREKKQDSSITTDVIVGFPGETDKHFNNTVAFVEKMLFMQLHVFKYSKRKGTAAESFISQVAADVKNERSKYLHEMSNLFWERHVLNFLEKTLFVLVEDVSEGYATGHTDNYIKVIFPENDYDCVGKIVPVIAKESIKDAGFVLGIHK